MNRQVVLLPGYYSSYIHTVLQAGHGLWIHLTKPS